MGEVINLRLVRKRNARAAAATRADENRRVFGRTAAEKAAETAERTRRTNMLDGARLDTTSPARPDNDPVLSE